MTFAYYASFDVSDRRLNLGAGTVTFSSSGNPDVTITLATDLAGDTADSARTTRVFNHYQPGSIFWTPTGEDASASTEIRNFVAGYGLHGQMGNAMSAAGGIAGWTDGTNLYCEFNTSDLRYTFLYTGHELTAITFSNVRVAALFGFDGDWTGSAETVTGELLPDFIIIPELSSVSAFADDHVQNYEPGGFSSVSASAMGSRFAITHPTPPVFRDWAQQSEPFGRVFRFAGSRSESVFKHQDLFELCSCVHPFVVQQGFDDGRDYLFKLRADTCVFNDSVCKRAGGEMDDALFDIIYQAQVLGAF